MPTRRKPKAQEPVIPSSHLELTDTLGFNVLRWQRGSLYVVCSDGSNRMEYLPKDLVNWEKKQFVRWCEDDTYAFPGWEPQVGYQFGGRYDTVQGALSWFKWLEDRS